MFIVLDLETTGLSTKDDAIIEIACVKIERRSFKEVARFTSFIHPEREIPDFIQTLTHISTKDIEDAPVFSEIRESLQEFLEGCPIIGHNIAFDVKFLQAAGIDISKNPAIDTFFLANFLCFQEKSLNLGYLCEVFGIEIAQAHRALDDTLATRELFIKLIACLQELPMPQKEIISYYLSHTQDMGLRVLRDTYLSEVKNSISTEDIVSYYIRSLEKNRVDIADKTPSFEEIKIDEFLSQIPDFELRENQKVMLDNVDISLSNGKKMLIEAPTGIGKTFAYLLPAISYSLKTGESVHISTSTKALQDQIYQKDLRLISQYFSREFTFTKLKGKRNYLSIGAFLEFMDETIFSSSMISFLLKILFWSIETPDGELDALDYYGEEYFFLTQIHAGAFPIFDEAHRYKHLEFALRARKRAKSANIVICNNHILFQDIISDGSLLGGVKNLILDEAHSLEDVVTQSLKKTISFSSFQNIMQVIEKKILKYKLDAPDFTLVRQNILYDVAELISLLESKLFDNFSVEAKHKMLLLEHSFFVEHLSLMLLSEKIIKSLEILQKYLEVLQDEKISYFSGDIQEISFLKLVLTEAFVANDTSKNIHFLSYDEQKGTQFSLTVLRPGDFLREHLWSKLESVVLTSATLQMQESFQYIQDTLKIHDFDTLVLPSDFDYAKQALVYIPQDLGSVKNNNTQIIAFLQSFFQVVGGKTLLLCTAFSMIREVYTNLKLSLEEKNIELLAQSLGGSKLKQIEAFKKNPEKSILIGTDTFWEGIDIPGEDLQYLIIHKIPFQVPTDPIFIARSKLYTDSFSQYAIPKSLIKLKQGFGRLIRSKKDTGVVVFLDDRIFSTSWGKVYIDAFPKEVKILYGSSQKLLEVLQNKE